MPGWGKDGTVRGPTATSTDRRQDLYQRYAAGLYRQALLTVGDAALAEQVVCDAIIDECALQPGAGDTGDRLAEAVFRSCHRLNADLARRNRRPAQRPSWDIADCLDPARLLSEYERGALGLVLFGGLGYIRASAVVGIDPRELALLLRAVLRRLNVPAQADGSGRSDGPAPFNGSAPSNGSARADGFRPGRGLPAGQPLLPSRRTPISSSRVSICAGSA
jgi:hypothetical protein